MRAGKNARLLVWVGSLFVLGLCGWGANAVVTQEPDDDEQSRQVVAAEVLNARPAPQTRRSSPPTRAAKGSPNPSSDLLGVTIWRLRPSASSDDTQARLLEHEADADTVLIAERVTA